MKIALLVLVLITTIPLYAVDKKDPLENYALYVFALFKTGGTNTGQGGF